MTVTSSFNAQVKPGRFDEAISLCRSAAKPLERLGAQQVRVLRGVVSTEAYGSLIMTMEYPDGEAWGAAYDRIMADDELVSLMARSESEGSPYASQSVNSAIEIPVDGPKKSGPILQVVISRANPGRFQDGIALCSRVAALQGKVGASGVRLFWVGAAGTLSGALVLVTECKDMKTLGKVNDRLLGEPEGQKLLEDVYGADSPGTIISEDIYSEITL